MVDKKMNRKNFREFVTASGAHVTMGKDEKSNDELMEQFKGEKNTIMHTSSPGSPFCVIEELNPSAKHIATSGAACANFSQDWRDNKEDVMMDVFTGEDISKDKGMKPGTWKVKKARKIRIKKEDIIKFEKIK